MSDNRTSGVLLHPTSLPGPHGIGDLGEGAFRFVDLLAAAGQSLWQVLPLGPTGYGDSPYASLSSFAGNPLLLSLDGLVSRGLLDPSDLSPLPDFPPNRVDYGLVVSWKMPLLAKAASRFPGSEAGDRGGFEEFSRANESWLDDYALYMALKERFDLRARARGAQGAAWNGSWDRDIALREPEALARWRRELGEAVRVQKVWQFLFFRQWSELRAYANSKGIRLVGDIPIFVAPDSADVWANRALFHLDANGRPTVVAGVPPDYFSATGQLWGNPLYDWEALRATGFTWWIERMAAALRAVDIVRIDHFRGFESYWEIPAGALTAERGRWVKAPGRELFARVKAALGSLPVMAEDLGIITPEVTKLRDELGFPGMAVLQFAFVPKAGGLDAGNPFLPHNHRSDMVVYTGTHDNDTTLGWYRGLSEAERDVIRRYLARDGNDIAWDFVRMALSSVARHAIVPLQDLLALDSSARMNRPSTVGGNWAWRLEPGQIDRGALDRLGEMTGLYGRSPQEL